MRTDRADHKAVPPADIDSRFSIARCVACGRPILRAAKPGTYGAHVAAQRGYATGIRFVLTPANSIWKHDPRGRAPQKKEV